MRARALPVLLLLLLFCCCAAGDAAAAAAAAAEPPLSPDDDATLSAQAAPCVGDADASAAAAGVARCASLAGTLRVSGALPAPPRALRSVSGALLLDGNDALASLRGAFPVLQRVDGDVALSDTRLVSLSGAFPALATIGGALRVAGNARMLSLGSADGILAAATANGAAFPALTTIGGDLVLSESAWGALDALSFRSLRSVGGDLRILRCASLAHIRAAFPRLLSIGGALSLANNSALKEMAAAFPALRSVGGSLELVGNAHLHDVAAPSLARLRALGGSLLIMDSALVDLSFLSSLATVNGGVVLRGNPGLISLHGLHNVRFVGGLNGDGFDLSGLPPAFGACGCALWPAACAAAGALPHRCYGAHYRACQAGPKPGLGAYHCVPTVMTWINSSAATSITASLLRDAGLADALAAPFADVTVLAPEDAAWLRAFGGGAAAGVTAAVGGAQPGVRRLLLRHVVPGARLTHELALKAVLDTWLSLSAASAGSGGVIAVAALGAPPPWDSPRCRGMPGRWAPCLLDGWVLKQVTVYSRDALAAALRGGSSADSVGLDADAGFGVAAAPCAGLCGLCASGCCCDAGCVEAGDCCAGAHATCPLIVPAASPPPTPPPALDADGFATQAAAAATSSLAERLLSRLKGMTEALADGARVIQPDLEAVNGVVDIVDRVLLAGGVRSPPPSRPPRPPLSPPPPAGPPPPPSPPRPPRPPGAQAASLPTDTTALLAGSGRPPPAADAGALPPPPAPPPPSPLPPPAAAAPGTPSGSCAARAPNICGMCDYTYASAGRACCCDAACFATGDCCPDFISLCVQTGM
jgi:hypothetical protein